MGYDWTRGLSGAAAGAAGGAAVGNIPGAVIGGGLGLLSGLAGDSSEQEQLYRDLLNKYADGTNDPNYRAQEAQLDELARTGMSGADRAAVMRQYAEAGQMAHGREGAIQQHEETMGGNARSGNSQLQQAQAAQEATTRGYLGGLSQDQAAGQRRLAAIQLAMQQRVQNAQALNRYRMAASGQLANQLDAQQESRGQSIGNAVNAVGGAIAQYANSGATAKAPPIAPRIVQRPAGFGADPLAGSEVVPPTTTWSLSPEAPSLEGNPGGAADGTGWLSSPWVKNPHGRNGVMMPNSGGM